MTRWEGKAFDASLPQGRADVRLQLVGSELVAETVDGTRLTLPLESLAFERQGTDGRNLVFSRIGSDFPRITSREPSLLDALRATGRPGVLRALGAESRSRRDRLVRRVVVPLGIVVVLAVALVWFVTGPLPGLVVAAIPPEADVELGKLGLEGTLEELGGEDGEAAPEVQAVVAKLIEPLLALQKNGPYEFKLHVVESGVVNAFALPGGAMIVTTGLLESAPSADAVIGVMAHEISHVTQRHGMRGIVQKLGLWVLVSAVLGDVSGVIALVSEQAAGLASLGFSREMESEADREGVKLLARAGLDPAGLRAFFESRKKDEDADLPESVMRFLSTHPVTDDRLAQIDALLAELPAGGERKKSDLDWTAFQAGLK